MKVTQPFFVSQIKGSQCVPMEECICALSFNGFAGQILFNVENTGLQEPGHRLYSEW